MPRNQSSKQKANNPLFIAVVVAIIGLLGTIINSYTSFVSKQQELSVQKTQLAMPVISTNTALFLTSLPTATVTAPIITLTEANLTSVPSPDLIFSEKFDDNKLGWYLEEGSINDNFLHSEIKYGKYSRYIKMNSDRQHYTSMRIPNISEKNFCLIFDAKKISGTKDAGIVITSRAINYTSDSGEISFYRVILYEDGTGLIRLYSKSGEERQIGEINNGIAWDDTLTHTVAISFQDNILEIIDWQTKTSVYTKEIANDDLLTDKGTIWIGTELFNPGDDLTIDFDNFLIYNRCPQ